MASAPILPLAPDRLLDDDRLSQAVAELRGHDAGDEVSDGARRQRNDGERIGFVGQGASTDCACTVPKVAIARSNANPKRSMTPPISYSAMTGFRSTPISLISTSITSPGFIQSGGLRRDPTPPGVPVAMLSPGNSVVNRER